MALLCTHALCAWYGDFQALYGVDIELLRGEVVTVIGANGAGKTTLMRSISGVVRNQANMVFYNGRAIGELAADEIAGRGIAMVPEGRRLFASLSVEENLLIGQFGGSKGRSARKQWNLSEIYGLFPILREKRNSPGTSLSGGQQQMVAIGRALMSNPQVLLFDEISLGLAPVVIKDIYQVVDSIRETGTSMIIVEQDISQALKVADRVYCMMEGRVTLHGTPGSLSRDAIHNAYFGVT